MNPQEQQAILTIALMAALADGEQSDRERENIRGIADSLGAQPGGGGWAKVYQDVLLKRVDLGHSVAQLGDAAQRELAYEMAVCVCEADGARSPAEAAFLNDLKARLKPDPVASAAFEKAEAQLVDAAATVAPVAVKAGAASPPIEVSASERLGPDRVALDKSILNYAMLTGALELLPQSWASMAIIPLQVKMVYEVGQAHGVALDQGHIREFIAAAGVGMGSQYLEQFGRKLIGGLLGKALGRGVGGVGRAATGMAFSFATTYALGQVAKRYYAGGRQMDTALLKESFQDLLGPAKQMQTQYLPQIQQKAASLDMGQVLAMVRGR